LSVLYTCGDGGIDVKSRKEIGEKRLEILAFQLLEVLRVSMCGGSNVEKPLFFLFWSFSKCAHPK
jgi:hypothetical protein